MAGSANMHVTNTVSIKIPQGTVALNYPGKSNKKTGKA